MSTRATYRFIPADPKFKPAITVYIHHDGYPSGAAGYLQGASSAEDFIRKNARAEITLSHEVHGDTEYRYDISRHGSTGTGSTINAYKREGYTRGYLRNDAAWVQFFDRSLDEFIEQNLNGESHV